MFKIMDAGQAAEMIKDGDCVCVNAFLALSNAEEIHKAIYERFIKTGSPKNLTLVSVRLRFLGEPIRTVYPRNAAKKLIFGHYGCMLRNRQAGCKMNWSIIFRWGNLARHKSAGSRIGGLHL